MEKMQMVGACVQDRQHLQSSDGRDQHGKEEQTKVYKNTQLNSGHQQRCEDLCCESRRETLNESINEL